MAPKDCEEKIPCETNAENASLSGKPNHSVENLTIVEFFEEAVQKVKIQGEETALVDESRGFDARNQNQQTMTFHELNELSTSLAGILRQQPLKTNPDGDTVVAICACPSKELIACIFAILKAGFAYLPLDSSFPESRILHIFDAAQPALLIADSEFMEDSKLDCFREQANASSLQELVNRAKEMKREEGELLKNNGMRQQRSPDAVAAVLFTSGSSGTPKGTKLSNRTVLNRLNWLWSEFPLKKEDKCCFKTSLTFVDSMVEIFGTLLQGLPLVIISRDCVSRPHEFLNRVEFHGITRLVLVPSFLRSILAVIRLEETNYKFDTVRLVMSSGDILHYELLKEFFSLFPNIKTIFNSYGSTEVGDVCCETFSSMDEVELKCVPCELNGASPTNCVARMTPIGSKVSFNTAIYILDENMNQVMDGQIGEICVTGINLANGYIGHENADGFVNNSIGFEQGFDKLYKMGDFGEIRTRTDGKRVLYYHGRTDSQVKVRGHRVELLEIQQAIKNSAPVHQCVVLCHHKGCEDQAIVAFISPVEGASIAEIETIITSSLLPYQVPILRFVTRFPYLVNGKVDRQALLEEFDQEQKADKESVDWDWDLVSMTEADRNDFKRFVNTISEVTKTPVISILTLIDQKSFFEVGGTSLNALIAISKLRDAGLWISIQEFVSATTIRAIYDCIQASGSVGKDSVSWIVTMGDRYAVQPLSADQREEVVHLCSRSFSEKGDLEKYISCPNWYGAYYEWFDSLWEDFLSQHYSFVVRQKTDWKMVGVVLNMDECTPPTCLLKGHESVALISKMIEKYEEAERTHLPEGPGKLLGTFIEVTATDLSAAESICLFEFMEEQTIQVAKTYGFEAILSTNTSPLTQQIARNNPMCKLLQDIRINQYVMPCGKRPFANAPDSEIIQVCGTFLQ